MGNFINNLASGAGGFFGSIVGAIAAKRQQKREFQQQENLLNLQNQFSLDMWEKQNAYNDPSQQMQRMIEAGINPNLAAAGIAGSPNTAASIESSAAPSVNSAVTPYSQSIGQSTMNALDSVLRTKQIDNVVADTKVKEEQAPMVVAEKNQFIQNVENLKSQKVLTDYEAEKLRPYAKYADEMFDMDWNLAREKVNEIQGQIRQIDKQIELADKEYEKMTQEIEESKQRVSLMEYQEQLAAAEKRYNDTLSALNNKKLELQNQGYDDSPVGLLMSKAAAGEDIDDDLKVLEKYHNSVARGEYNADPTGEEYRSLYDYRKMIHQAIDIVRRDIDYIEHLPDDQRSRIDVDYYYEKLRDLQDKLSTSERDFHTAAYKKGDKTFWDDFWQKITGGISTGVGIGVGAAATRGVGAIGASKPKVDVSKHGTYWYEKD